MSLLTTVIIIIEILAGAEVDLFVPSFPEIQQVFDLTPFTVELMLGLNFCAYTISTFIVGNLGDKYGTKPVIIWGLAGFVCGSLTCALAPSYGYVLAGRVLQGIGIAGPSALAYVVIAHQYSVDKQQEIMGWLNGTITLAMAVAPIVGSYISLHFGWRGNFITLCIFGILTLILGMAVIPKHTAPLVDKKEGEGGYMPVIRSGAAMWYITAICCLTAPYWIFIGISPILYMDGFGVPLDSFGYYQGSIAFIFAILSFGSGVMMSIFGKKNCFYGSLAICIVAVIVIALVCFSDTGNPLIVTASVGLLSAGTIFPINILWPYMLETVPGAKSRLSAVLLAVKLMLSTLGLQFVSYFYDGTFFNIGAVIVCGTLVALCAIWTLIRRGYLVLWQK